MASISNNYQSEWTFFYIVSINTLFIITILFSITIVFVVAEKGDYDTSGPNPFLLISNLTSGTGPSANDCQSSIKIHEIQVETASAKARGYYNEWHPTYLFNHDHPRKRELLRTSDFVMVSPNLWKINGVSEGGLKRDSIVKTTAKITGWLVIHRGKKDVDVSSIQANATNIGSCVTTNECYGYIGGGATWKTSPYYNVDSSNSLGISDQTVLSTLESSRNKWNNAAGCNIWNGVNTDLIVDGGDFQSPDGKNEITFEYLSDTNILAVVITWGFFDGKVSDREIIESDMVFNTNAGTYPFECVALHEWGHMFGMIDIYREECSDNIMYGFIDVDAPDDCVAELMNDDVFGVRELCSENC